MPHRIVAALALAAALAAMNGHAAFAQGALDASRADAISARFLVGQFATTLPPVALAAGSAPPAYNKHAARASFDTILKIADGPSSAVPAALYVHLFGITDHASGNMIAVDGFGAQSETKIAAADMSLDLDPPPAGGTVAPLTPLRISATGIQASADYTVVVPQFRQAAASASFASLRIMGALVGGKTITYSGTPPANFTLFSTEAVTIILNQQIIEAAVGTCTVSKGCAITPGGILANAVHVELSNADIGGHLVSGSVSLGTVSAN